MLQGVPIRSVREKPLDLITYRPLVKGPGGFCVESELISKLGESRGGSMISQGEEEAQDRSIGDRAALRQEQGTSSLQAARMK